MIPNQRNSQIVTRHYKINNDECLANVASWAQCQTAGKVKYLGTSFLFFFCGVKKVILCFLLWHGRIFGSKYFQPTEIEVWRSRSWVIFLIGPLVISISWTLDIFSSKAKEHDFSLHIPFYKHSMDCVQKASHNVAALCPQECSLLLRMVSISIIHAWHQIMY